MKTVAQWLNGILADQKKMHHWLQRQYVGERLAADRIKQIAVIAAATKDLRSASILERIAMDEAKHANWVLSIIEAAGVEVPRVTLEGSRYWTGDELELPFNDLMALGHHAEAMRLQRIVALAVDTRVPKHIHDIFSMILPDVVYHAKAFARLSDAEAVERMRHRHDEGLARLGLET